MFEVIANDTLAPQVHRIVVRAPRVAAARLPGQLAKSRDAAKMSRYRLEKNCKITDETIGQIEQGETNPSVCILAQICHGLGMTLTEFVALLEDGR